MMMTSAKLGNVRSGRVVLQIACQSHMVQNVANQIQADVSWHSFRKDFAIFKHGVLKYGLFISCVTTNAYSPPNRISIVCIWYRGKKTSPLISYLWSYTVY